jgi:predicted TIM-barrel fold metal-dependent hydrolase
VNRRVTAAWYDRHLDPAWQDLLLTPPNADRERIPLAYVMPKSAEDLTRMGRSFAKTTFLSAGNITDTPAYGNLIALGVLTALQAHQAPNEQIAEAISYREQIARSGRFLTYSDDVQDGITELERAARLSLSGAMITEYPAEDRRYDQPEYEPFWATAAALDLPLSLHTATRRQGKIRGAVPERCAMPAAARPRRSIRRSPCAI